MTRTYLDILTLRRALEIAGGEDELALRLKVSHGRLISWLAAETPLPRAVFLRAVDVVMEYDESKRR